MEEWRVFEEWGQAPEVQSHQLRQLCGANTEVEEERVEDEFAKEREGGRQRCGDWSPITKTGQLRVEGMLGNSEEREGLKENISESSFIDPQSSQCKLEEGTKMAATSLYLFWYKRKYLLQDIVLTGKVNYTYTNKSN